MLDLPEVVGDGLSKICTDLKSRVTFAAHDFFTERPEVAKGVDVYLFCRIFHNWSDKYSIKILRCLIPALKYGARILISDICSPEPNVLPSTLEKTMQSVSIHCKPLRLQSAVDVLTICYRASDLGMMVMLNAKERGRDDWAELFREADARFRFFGVENPPSSQMSFIKAIWEGNDEM